MDGGDGHDADEDEHIQDTRGDSVGGVDGDNKYGDDDCDGNVEEGGPGDGGTDGVDGKDGTEDEDKDDGECGDGGRDSECGGGVYVGEGGQARGGDDAELGGDGGGRSRLPRAALHISEIECITWK